MMNVGTAYVADFALCERSTPPPLDVTRCFVDTPGKPNWIFRAITEESQLPIGVRLKRLTLACICEVHTR